MIPIFDEKKGQPRGAGSALASKPNNNSVSDKVKQAADSASSIMTNPQKAAPGKSAEKAKSSAAGNNSILNKPLSYVWLRAQQITQKIQEFICDASIKFVIFREEHDTEFKLIENVIIIATLAVITVMTDGATAPLLKLAVAGATAGGTIGGTFAYLTGGDWVEGVIDGAYWGTVGSLASYGIGMAFSSTASAASAAIKGIGGSIAARIAADSVVDTVVDMARAISEGTASPTAAAVSLAANTVVEAGTLGLAPPGAGRALNEALDAAKPQKALPTPGKAVGDGASVGSVVDLNIKPTVQDTKLQNIIDNLYKGQDNPRMVGNGTTMDAVRNEALTGNPTGGTFHTIKAQESINGLTNLLDSGGLSQEDGGTQKGRRYLCWVRAMRSMWMILCPQVKPSRGTRGIASPIRRARDTKGTEV